jgi:hypothetical protein
VIFTNPFEALLAVLLVAWDAGVSPLEWPWWFTMAVLLLLAAAVWWWRSERAKWR